MRIRALTISQPWASMIAAGIKWVENRHWDAPASCLGGMIAIHAGKGLQYLTKEEVSDYSTGAIIATAKLARCIRIGDIRRGAIETPDVIVDRLSVTYRQLAEHPFTGGTVCWVLQDIQAIEPIAYRGAQGLWWAEIEPVPCDPARYAPPALSTMMRAHHGSTSEGAAPQRSESMRQLYAWLASNRAEAESILRRTIDE